MARVLSNHLVVGAQWETLIGLQKEMTEIRSLARSRDASHFAVTDDGAGTRTVGLAAGLGASPADTPACYALAALLGAFVDAPNVAFLHPDPDDPAMALFVTLRDHRPELDLSVPASALRERLEQWCAEIDGPVKRVGVMRMDLPHADVVLTLDDIAASLRQDPSNAQATREALEQARIKLVRKALPARELKIAAGLVVALAVVGGGLWWGWSWYDSAQQAKLAAANRVDPIVAYQRALARAIAAEPFSTGASYARHVQRVVQRLPVNAGGWRPVTIDCKAKRCDIAWQRQEGGTFDLLLSQRPNAQIVDLDHAREVLMLTDEVSSASAATSATTATTATTTPPHADPRDSAAGSDAESPEEAADARVAPVPRNQFLRTAGARLQALGDYGMDIALSMPSPLVPLPPDAASRNDIPPAVSKGEWKIAGHLAFFDSVAGLMMRAGNMSLTELKVAIDDGKPVFSAQGTYYVH
ncbi:type 4b pilus protein PilO2 [Pandoraea pnomenusa]|uniref:type 4b pilus protein PilO2 n=1 Tax=Pandoraea pnomenusa TaxID=93220 RepID=UPI00333EE11E